MPALLDQMRLGIRVRTVTGHHIDHRRQASTRMEAACSQTLSDCTERVAQTGDINTQPHGAKCLAYDNDDGLQKRFTPGENASTGFLTE
ncbi:hypothetical protein WAE31_11125 (plasmid) [Xanthomonas axonopodis pv. vasculorum]